MEQTTGVSLTKGDKVELTKGNAALNRVLVGLGWDTRQGGGPAFDLDAFAVVLGTDGKLYQHNDKSIIYFGHKVALGIQHMGDNLTGQGEGDDEQIHVRLGDIPTDADQVVIAVNIYEADTRNERFGQVKNASIRLADITNSEPGTQLLKYDLSEDYSSNTGVIMGRFYRHSGEWKFEAIGEGVNGNINQICARYQS